LSKLLKRRSIGDLTFSIINYTFFIIFSIIILFPFWDTVVVSLAIPGSVSALGFHLWPAHITLDSYQYIFSDPKVLYAYANTIFITVVSTLITIIITMFAAYPLSKKDLPGRDFFTILFLITMFFSGGLIPFYLLVKGLGMINSLWSLILPSSLSAFNVILVRNFLMSIDKALEEAAFVEGANYGTVLFKIIIPLSKPIIATVALWTAVGNWNAWFNCLIFIQDEHKIVLQVLLKRMLDLTSYDASKMDDFVREGANRKVVSYTAQAAITIGTIGPIVLVYPFLQKYFVKGIMIGSLKG